MKKLITVIIPCYNHGSFICEAIASVINNDIENICEIIVVNDGSTDQLTIDTLNSLEGETILVFHQENLGLAKARNKGIELATTEYLLMLDADNKINRDFLKHFKFLIETNVEFDMLHGNSEYFGEKNGLFVSNSLNLFKICFGNYIDACSIIKTSALKESGLYDDKMPYMGWEDWDLWIRFALNRKQTIYVDKVFFDYRYMNNSMIRTNANKENEIRLYLIEKYNLPFFNRNYLNELLNQTLEEKINTNFKFTKLIKLSFYKIVNILRKKNKLKIEFKDNFY
jgi:glycosyltransferase involved in cell wall biosynthesis